MSTGRLEIPSRNVGWIRDIVLHGPDQLALAQFCSQMVGGWPFEWYDGIHFDVLVEDLENAHERAPVESAGLDDLLKAGEQHLPGAFRVGGPLFARVVVLAQ